MSTHGICERWILDQTELQGEEKELLASHLAECTECSRLQRNVAESTQFLQKARTIKPAAGFTNRWKSMKAQREAEQEQLSRIRIFFGVLGAMGILSAAFCFVFFLPENFNQTISRVSKTASAAAILWSELRMLIHAFQRPLLLIAIVFFVLLTIYVFALVMSARSVHKNRKGKEEMVYEDN